MLPPPVFHTESQMQKTNLILEWDERIPFLLVQPHCWWTHILSLEDAEPVRWAGIQALRSISNCSWTCGERFLQIYLQKRSRDPARTSVLSRRPTGPSRCRAAQPLLEWYRLPKSVRSLSSLDMTIRLPWLPLCKPYSSSLGSSTHKSRIQVILHIHALWE